MAVSFPENKMPEKARTDMFSRQPIICGALIKTILGKNVAGINDYFSNIKQTVSGKSKFGILILKLKMVYYRYAYEFSFKEFYNYNFEYKKKKDCLNYVPGYEMMRLYNEIYFDTETYNYFADKRETYNLYKKYYKRDVIYVSSLQDLGDFSVFVQEHKKFIAKPPLQNNGKGIFVVDLTDGQTKAYDVFSKCVAQGGMLIEEFINQGKEMSCLSINSVNTVRFITYYKDNHLTMITAFLRMGLGNSYVDNASQGGLFAGIDINTGKLTTDAYKKNVNDYYSKHPDTDVAIKGFQLPEWGKLLEVVRSIVTVYPEKTFVGWDFAYGDKGWVLIEANGGPGIYAAQMSNQTGLRKAFSDTVFNDSKYAKKYKTAKL